MTQIGRKIYYELATGNAILDTGERKGDVIETTVEQDISIYTVLTERNRDTFDYIELEYGQYAQDFAECNGYRVDVATKSLQFSYPDPNQPTADPIYIKPLTEQVTDLQAQNAQMLLALVNGGLM